ncbi:unnamed protein product [Ascophyllum nodosum]
MHHQECYKTSGSNGSSHGCHGCHGSYESEGGLAKALEENAILKKRIKELREAAAAKDKNLRAIVSQLKAMQLESERVKKRAELDLVARRGQTQKLAILEHTVSTLRRDLQINLERRQNLEGKLSILERSWHNERSLRLQDLHRQDVVSSQKKNAKEAAEITERKWLEAEQQVEILKNKLESRVCEHDAQRQINVTQGNEICAQAAEIELHRADVLRLKRMLYSRQGEISSEKNTSANLRRELSRVRREFMCMCRTSNRSEQQSAFEGVGVKDGNRVAAPAIDRSKQGYTTNDSNASVSRYYKYAAAGRGGRVKARRSASINSAASTLFVPGSLHLGRGLGLKKAPTWNPPAGSAKAILEAIMEKHTSMTVNPDQGTL